MSFDKNKNLDDLINLVNDLLFPIEKEQMERIGHEDHEAVPVMFLLGTPRSGSTLFTQWVASQEAFAYPSNFLSRFYKAPYIGALIYKMVTDPAYQYRDEFSDINKPVLFSSSIGKTKGFKSPHEFWYFWRRFVEFPDVPCSEKEFEQNFHWLSFKRELSLLLKAFGKPFLFKSHIVNWYYDALANNLDHSLFIHLYRDPLATTRSLLRAREEWTGSRANWFSFKPREYALIKDMDTYHQIAGQIYFIDKEILGKKEKVGNRYLSFSYEEFCADPSGVYQKIADKIASVIPGYKMPRYQGEKKFTISNPVSAEDEKIKEAYQYFEREYGQLIF